jgi:DNA-binding HxlR family transcriptional regulator
MALELRREFSCGVEVALAIVGGKWKPVILAHLKQGPMRYGDLRRAIPRLSDKMLAQRLRELESFGLVTRRKRGGRGAHSVYALTARVQALRPALAALNAWGTKMSVEVGARIASPAPDSSDLQQ